MCCQSGFTGGGEEKREEEEEVGLRQVLRRVVPGVCMETRRGRCSGRGLSVLGQVVGVAEVEEEEEEEAEEEEEVGVWDPRGVCAVGPTHVGWRCV